MQNRFTLVRDALRAHLKCLDNMARESQDRKGYLKQPQSPGESRGWEAEAAWPEK